MVIESIEVMSTAEAIETVKKYVKAVKALGVNVKKVFLFGSYARNHQTEWSDIDVALIGDDFTGVRFIDKTPFRRLHNQSEFMIIETHTFPASHLTEHDAFLEEIIKMGIEII